MERGINLTDTNFRTLFAKYRDKLDRYRMGTIFGIKCFAVQDMKLHIIQKTCISLSIIIMILFPNLLLMVGCFACYICNIIYSCIYILLSLVLKTQIVDITGQNVPLQFTAIDTSKYSGFEDSPVSLSLPLELLQEFDDGDGLIGIVSASYRNVDMIFSSGIDPK